MFRKLWKAKKEIAQLIDDVLDAAADRQITQAEIDTLTLRIVDVVRKIQS